MSKYTIGIDLGGTTMTAGIVNENYEIVGKLTWATRLPRPAEDLEKALADLCRTVARDNKVDFADIKYVGIGTPGSVNFTTGFVGFNTNFGYYDWNLGPDLEDLLGCKVYVENDANAAAYGEYIAGHMAPGAPYTCITDRREAIYAAVKMAEPGDIVLFAGKGHEDYQLINGKKLHFVEREIIKEACAEISK